MSNSLARAYDGTTKRVLTAACLSSRQGTIASLGERSDFSQTRRPPYAECYEHVQHAWPGRLAEEHSAQVRGDPRSLGQGTLLRASNTFVLQDPDHNPTVLGLPFCRLIVTYLPALTHGAGRQHSGQSNMTLLLEKLRHIAGPIFT